MDMTLQYRLPPLEGLTETEARSEIRAHILRYINSTPQPDRRREIMVLVDPMSNFISFFENSLINAEPILEGLLPAPASKASIEAMAVVKILDEGIDCSICLLDFKSGEEAKEMPCKHRFHAICIDKWLGINGSCPICRFKMPVDEQCEKKDAESGESERGDDGGSDMQEDRGMLAFKVVVTPDTIDVTVSITALHRHSSDVLRGAGDADVSEARNGDEFEAGDDGDDDESEAVDGGDDGDDNGSEAVDGGDDDEIEVADGDESEV